MRLLRKPLLLASAMAALCVVHSAAYGQLRELGTGAPGPLQAPHLTAELVSDFDTMAPGKMSRALFARGTQLTATLLAGP